MLDQQPQAHSLENDSEDVEEGSPLSTPQISLYSPLAPGEKPPMDGVNQVLPHTLAYIIASLPQGVRGVTEVLPATLDDDPRMKKLYKVWRLLVEQGKPSAYEPQIFDVLCEQVQLPIDKFMGYVMAAAVRLQRPVTLMGLSAAEAVFVNELVAMMRRGNKLGLDAIKLFGQITGLVPEKGAPPAIQINVNDQSKTVMIEGGRGLPDLEGVKRAAVTVVRRESQRLLEEGDEESEGSVLEVEEVIPWERKKEMIRAQARVGEIETGATKGA